MLECRFNKTTHHPKSALEEEAEKEEEEFITSSNWRDNSLSRGAGADQP